MIISYLEEIQVKNFYIYCIIIANSNVMKWENDAF